MSNIWIKDRPDAIFRNTVSPTKTMMLSMLFPFCTWHLPPLFAPYTNGVRIMQICPTHSLTGVIVFWLPSDVSAASPRCRVQLVCWPMRPAAVGDNARTISRLHLKET